jgi:integrase
LGQLGDAISSISRVQQEVARLLDAEPGLKYKAALRVAYGAGLRAAEVVSLKVCDIDSERIFDRDQVHKPVERGFINEATKESRQLSYAPATCSAILKYGLRFHGRPADNGTSLQTAWA